MHHSRHHLYALYDGEPVPNACVRPAEERQKMPPYSRDTGDRLRWVRPSLWPSGVEIHRNISKRSVRTGDRGGSLELERVVAPYRLGAMDREDGDDDAVSLRHSATSCKPWGC